MFIIAWIVCRIYFEDTGQVPNKEQTLSVSGVLFLWVITGPFVIASCKHLPTFEIFALFETPSRT